MAITQLPYDSLEREEFISASEYQQRRRMKEIDVSTTRIAPPDFERNKDGGFMVKLPVPRYRQSEFPLIEGHRMANGESLREAIYTSLL